MPTIPEELDVFYVPHYHMKNLVKDIEQRLKEVNFCDNDSYVFLLNELSERFHAFEVHEEIENKYILQPLLPRLPSNIQTTLHNDLHHDGRLSDLMTFVNSAPRSSTSQEERESIGTELRISVTNFTVDFIPHMNEEEEVFLPLLMQYYSTQELKQLTEEVMRLHHLTKSDLERPEYVATPKTTPTFLSLPPEVILKILSYLDDPRDLCRVAQTHPSLSTLAYDGCLWEVLQPVRWAEGNWKFFNSLDLLSTNKITHDAMLDNDMNKQLLSCGDSINATLNRSYTCCHSDTICHTDTTSERHERERMIMEGLITCVLPKTGSHVKVLDLAFGMSLTSEMVYRMIRLCPNIAYLDLTSTMVTDYVFKGLLDSGGGQSQLKYINLTNCPSITDTTLLRIAWACTTPLMTTPTYCTNCRCEKSIYSEAQHQSPWLQCLVMSGCYNISDIGLRALAMGCGLPNLQYLDLSGVPRVTAAGLNELISKSPSLAPECLFYCDSIQNGPHKTEANGCLDTSSALCCRNIYKT